jgi:uncharacterized protein YggE
VSRNKRHEIVILRLALVGLTAIGLIQPPTIYAQAKTPSHVIEAHGHGEAIAKPDSANIRLLVAADASNAVDAVSYAKATAKAVSETLKAQLAEVATIEATAINVQEIGERTPRRASRAGPPQICKRGRPLGL